MAAPPPNPPSLAYGRASDGGSGGMASNLPLGSKKESHQPATCPQFPCLTTRGHPTEFLRSEIEASPFNSEMGRTIHIWTVDFNERVDDLIRAVKARSPRVGRGIFLLDQYGWSQVAFRSVRAILDALPKAEVFLTFSVDSLIDYLSDRSSELTKAFGEIDVDPAFISELLRLKEGEQAGFRAALQNGLYGHIQQNHLTTPLS